MTDELGGRLPLADPTTLNPEQRAVFDRMMTRIVPWAEDAGFQITARDGRLIGPFNAALLNPAVTERLLDVHVAERAHTSLNTRVREVVILAVGAVWQAEYELYAHTALARAAGLSAYACAVIAAGGEPDELTEHESIALQLTRELSSRHNVGEQLYQRAEDAFGPHGLIDIAFLIGLYHSVCTTLTLFAVPPPQPQGHP
ncbi:carboxymuconolactone decarboxylase [Mycobacterium sp. CBMA 234]|uniref:carboxymuconolactone decarboxylase family protein n=1 Tax=Mycolicibacterium sp. CBMA 234 TaxID=1918495 RepID=UPI00281685AC|nr:carboxymuconolactone decarboxylase family protein [Mycolicibacterium sp. CBMA 234]MUL68201.1 carboxymuconolactone decarboxylase [Mycolicibacterium sp. CBMA 234]